MFSENFRRSSHDHFPNFSEAVAETTEDSHGGYEVVSMQQSGYVVVALQQSDIGRYKLP